MLVVGELWQTLGCEWIGDYRQLTVLTCSSTSHWQNWRLSRDANISDIQQVVSHVGKHEWRLCVRTHRVFAWHLQQKSLNQSLFTLATMVATNDAKWHAALWVANGLPQPSFYLYTYSGGDQSEILGGPLQATSLPPSILLSSLPSRGLSRGSGWSLLTHCQTFWCNVYCKNSLVKSTLMLNVLQKSACMQSSATIGRSDTMHYRPCIAAWH